MTGRSGLTMVELLVSVAILVFVGLTLAVMLSSTAALWKAGEGRRATEEEGRAILDGVVRDFEALLPASSAGVHPAGLVARGNAAGDFLVRFVRARGASEETVETRLAGDGTPADGYTAPFVSGRPDPPGTRHLAPGAAAEVFYFFDAREETLWRGERSPVGAPGSFFDPGTLTGRDAARALGDEVSANLLAFSVLFWGPETTTWEPLVAPGAGGPLKNWDSTAALESGFPYHGDIRGSVMEGAFLPAKVRILLFVGSPDGLERTARLYRPLSAEDRTLVTSGRAAFSDPDEGYPYLKIEEEWVEISDREGNTFSLRSRGALGSKATDHPLTRADSNGDEQPVLVRSGRILARTIDLSCATLCSGGGG